MPRDTLPVSTDGRDALAVSDSIVREAGALIREASRGMRAMEHKGRNNVVTATDHASEALIIERIEAEGLEVLAPARPEPPPRP